MRPPPRRAEHYGLTNDFLINSENQLAMVYNDKSPMENHHLSAVGGRSPL